MLDSRPGMGDGMRSGNGEGMRIVPASGVTARIENEIFRAYSPLAKAGLVTGFIEPLGGLGGCDALTVWTTSACLVMTRK
jgi:hypothetical protein